MSNETPSPHNIVHTASLTLSAVLSPLLVPTYACAIALWITPLAILPERMRFALAAIIFLITAAVPMGVIIYMMRTGRVADSALSVRKQRTVPYLVTAIAYVCAAMFLGYEHAPRWMTCFYIGASMACLLALVINTAWKISAHLTTMGGLCALVLFIAAFRLGIVNMLVWVSVVFVLAGAVGSARLYLQRHTPAQVYAGFAMGLIVEWIFLCWL